jgi:hypothetical protein
MNTFIDLPGGKGVARESASAGRHHRGQEIRLLPVLSGPRQSLALYRALRPEAGGQHRHDQRPVRAGAPRGPVLQ